MALGDGVAAGVAEPGLQPPPELVLRVEAPQRRSDAVRSVLGQPDPAVELAELRDGVHEVYQAAVRLVDYLGVELMPEVVQLEVGGDVLPAVGDRVPRRAARRGLLPRAPVAAQNGISCDDGGSAALKAGEPGPARTGTGVESEIGRSLR